MNILLINGPNLNLLGTRETKIYGKLTLSEIVTQLKETATTRGARLIDFQSNHEGEIIDCIQREGKAVDCILINAASLTHTSIGIRDALLATEKSFIEIHLSNIYRRENFRQKSYLSDIAIAVIAGLGPSSYLLALDFVLNNLNKES